MARGEIEVSVKGPSTDGSGEDSGVRVVAVLTGLVGRLLAIHEREHPRASVLVRSIETGSGDGVPPRGGRIRFEIRSHEAVRVARVEEEIAALVAGADRSGVVEVRGEMIARRSPGDLGADHPLVAKAREILGLLGIETHVAPSVSELALLLERGIPSLTLGITRGENRHSSAESIRLEPIFDGLAQIVALLQFMDDGGNY
jgi:metal-dependent amidase/aminoacylase/carboxypeptidase family protein